MKLYFGNKTILIDFLNDLFAGEKIIEDLVYLESEQDGEAEEDRRTIFDLNCKGGNGEYFIIEMQQFQQNFFIDRAIYYTSRLISKKVKKGKKGLITNYLKSISLLFSNLISLKCIPQNTFAILPFLISKQRNYFTTNLDLSSSFYLIL